MDWREQAICRDAPDADLWFPIGETGPAALQIFEAKSVCRHCPALSQCLTYALDNNIQFGIYGGMTEQERAALKQRQARTREKARAAEKPTPPAVESEPVRVDGQLMAAPGTVEGRLYQDRMGEQRLHALLDSGWSACGSVRLDVGRQRPVADLRAARRCRTKACKAVFTVADREFLAVTHG